MIVVFRHASFHAVTLAAVVGLVRAVASSPCLASMTSCCDDLRRQEAISTHPAAPALESAILAEQGTHKLPHRIAVLSR
jgi:hypothetical protein